MVNLPKKVLEHVVTGEGLGDKDHRIGNDEFRRTESVSGDEQGKQVVQENEDKKDENRSDEDRQTTSVQAIPANFQDRNPVGVDDDGDQSDGD